MWRCRPTTSMGRRNSNAEHSVLRPASRTTVGGVSVSTATIRPSLPWRPLYARYPARSRRSANGHYPPEAVGFVGTIGLALGRLPRLMESASVRDWDVVLALGRNGRLAFRPIRRRLGLRAGRAPPGAASGKASGGGGRRKARRIARASAAAEPVIAVELAHDFDHLDRRPSASPVAHRRCRRRASPRSGGGSAAV